MSVLVGFIAAMIAAICFGSNYIPVKSYDMGDGMYFQFVMGVGIWVFGLFYFIYLDPTTGYFHPLAMLGGLIWSIGNVMTVPIIKMIGMALGLSIWSATSLVIGWMIGKLGILGFKKDTSVDIEWLNYLGLTLCVCALALFFMVKPNDEELQTHNKLSLPEAEAHIFNPNVGHMGSTSNIFEKRQALVNEAEDPILRKDMEHEIEIVESWVDKLTNKQKQYFGVGGAILAGVCYGTCFCPIQYVINNHNKHDSHYSQKLEDYAFCHYCGILISSIGWFVIYCIWTKNNPQVNNKATLPALISGFMWSIAQAGYFTAMDKQNLGPDTTFPIVSGSPQIVAALWGVFLFKEIKPGKNMLVLFGAIVVGVCGITCITLAKF